MSTLLRLGLPAAAFALWLTGCAVVTPPEGVSRADGGIDAVIARFGVPQPEAGDGLPLLPAIARALARTDPAQRLAGTTYSLETGNRLPRDWLVQTPTMWDQPAAALPPGHSDWLPARISRLVASAQRAVDITLLQPPADFRFLDALRKAVMQLAHSGRRVTMRILIGDYPPQGTDARRFLADLLQDAARVRRSRLTLYAGATRSCEGGSCGSLSWNHAKIVAVDGRRALVGGHNMWTQDYLEAAPVHDLSMEIEGPAARAAHRFADALWAFVCAEGRPGSVNDSYEFHAGADAIGSGCLAHLALPDPVSRPGRLPVLAVGRLASGIAENFADQSQLARTLAFGAAQKTIRMLQQDVAFALPGLAGISWPDSDLERIVDLLARGGDVSIVLSNAGAKGPVGSYSNGVPIERVAATIRRLMIRRHDMPEAALVPLLCAHLHLAPLRFGADASWPGDRPIGVHAKFWMVDDRLFYIGSENLYPVDLQEFGYVLEDAAAGAEIRRDYWDRLWRWSSRAAISGADAPRCIFRGED